MTFAIDIGVRSLYPRKTELSRAKLQPKMLEFRAKTSCYISSEKREEKDMEGIVKEVGPKILPEE